MASPAAVRKRGPRSGAPPTSPADRPRSRSRTLSLDAEATKWVEDTSYWGWLNGMIAQRPLGIFADAFKALRVVLKLVSTLGVRGRCALAARS